MVIHRAWKVSGAGRVSALCSYPTPRAIKLRQASWTLNAPLVSCSRCRELQKQMPEEVDEPAHER